jgi:hypothetical protein
VAYAIDMANIIRSNTVKNIENKKSTNFFIVSEPV